MARVTIKDFIISLGFESEAVTKGLDKVSNQVKGFSKEFIGAGNAQKNSSKQVLASTEAVTQSKKRQLAIDKQAAKIGTLKKGQAPARVGTLQKGQAPAPVPDFKDSKSFKKLDPRVAREKARYNVESDADREVLKRKKAITNELEKASKIKLDKAMQFGPSRKDMGRIKKSYKNRVEAQKAMHNLTSQAERMDEAKTKAENKPALDAAKKQAMADRALERTNKKLMAGQHTEANREDNRREKEAVKLTKKLATAQQGVQRKLDDINRKYGESNKLIRQKVIAEGAGSKRADATVREVNELKQTYERLLSKIRETKTASGLGKLNRQLQTTSDNTRHTTQQLDRLNRKLTAGKFAARGMSDSMRNLGRSYVSIFAIGAGAVAAGRIGQDLIASKAALLGASGSAVQAAEDFEFLRETSAHLGTSLRESVGGYAKIGAAARAAGLGVDEARNMFLAAQETSAAFQLSADDTSGVQRAFSQILAKGKLSTEELLQLGERIPIAFSAAADAMDMETPELIKKIETGELMSVDFLPNFSTKMREYVKESGQLAAALETSKVAMGRFKQAFELGILKTFDSGMEDGLASFFKNLSVVIERMTPVFEFIGKVFGALFDIVGSLARAFSVVSPLLFALGNDGANAVNKLNGELAGTISLVDAIVGGLKFIVGALILIPALMERMEGSMGSLPTLAESKESGALKARVKSSSKPEFHRPTGTPTTTKSTTINIQANDADHVANIVKSTIQEDLTLNYGA